MIYINGGVVVIDFNVLQSKSYSFLIEDQLCDLEVEMQDGKFAYSFSLDTKADTPANLRRRKRDRRDMIHTLLFAVGLVSLIVFSVLFVLNRYGYF